MKRLGNYLISILFIGCIFAIGGYFQLSTKGTTSFNENRTLAKAPELTYESVMDGTFTKDFETYFTDHFAGKGLWVQGYFAWQRLTNQTFIMDYYVSSDDWIYPKPINYLAYSNIDKSIANVTELSEYTEAHDMELYYFSLPNRYLALGGDFPSYINEGYEHAHKNYLLDGLSALGTIGVVDIGKTFTEQFSHDELKDFYYQTDHHWNVDGALEGFKQIYSYLNENSKHFNEPEFNEDSYIKTCYDSERFLGSYNRQLYEMIDTDDAVCTATPKDFDYNDLEVYKGPVQDDLKVPWNNIYGKDLNKGLRVIDYGGIFTGDFKELNFINPDKEAEGTKVLFIKDSYANPLTFWLAEHFYQTTFYDLRYNKDRTLYEFLEGSDYDIIAFLYNDTTVFSTMYDFHLQEQ